ncbi:solute carrier family 22 member 21 [Plakobranchus ocellatus]|uniref:Solute carrier family 22 member 21 n=1 Tax=Plakobranchus ocellatus TaxID=259542 RepID=A0AAV4CHB7_9GAST|nr:solute carrier family 22 member 21 [Plakobranchus ocellatus]
MAPTIEQIFDELGGFHWFQLLMVLWVYSIKAIIAWSMMLMSFAGYESDSMCIVDRLVNQSAIHDMNESQIRQIAEEGTVDNETFLNVCEVNGTDCDDFYFFGVKRTVISEWNLVCDLQWMKAVITSIQFGGVLAGSVIGGQSGDYLGRKKTLYGSYLLHTVLNVISAYSINWQMFAVMRFSIGIMIGVVLVMIVPYPTEFFPLRWRHSIPAIPMWPLGVLAFAGGAWLLEDWANLQLACAAAALPGLLGYFYIPESARWLATRGRLEESHAVLAKMARVNGKKLPPTAMETIKEIAREEKISRKGKDYSYFDIFRGRATAQLTLIVAFKWVVLSMVFYGLSFAVTSFAGDLYLNMFLMSIVELPAYLLTFLLIDRIGRRWTCLGFLAVTTLVSFACVGLHLKAPDDVKDRLISACCLTAKLAVAACWAASQTWVTESYPTVTRSLGYGFANTSSRVGAIIAPFVINLDQMPLFTFILMGTLTLASMILTCFIPETKDKVMAETVHRETHEGANEKSEPQTLPGRSVIPFADTYKATSDSKMSTMNNFVGSWTDSTPLSNAMYNSQPYENGTQNQGYEDICDVHEF